MADTFTRIGFATRLARCASPHPVVAFSRRPSLHLLCAALALIWCGCAEPRTRYDPPQVNATASNGVPVTFPAWITDDLRVKAMEEIDAANVPPGYQVVVRLPVFETWASKSGLARGLCDRTNKVIHVGWRFWPYEVGEEKPLMPALLHEVKHANGMDDESTTRD